MKIVEKKILPKYFEEIIKGNKKFEIRKDEDNLEVGDLIILKEYMNEKYTGREYQVKIKYILRNVSEYGLKDEYLIFNW